MAPAVTTKYLTATVAVTASVTLSNAGFNVIKFVDALSTGTIEIQDVFDGTQNILP